MEFIFASVRSCWSFNENIQYPITNVLTGLQQPTISRDDNSLIFAGYSGIGWDLYSLNQPLTLKKKSVAPTQFHMNDKLDLEDIVILDVIKVIIVYTKTNLHHTRIGFCQRI